MLLINDISSLTAAFPRAHVLMRRLKQAMLISAKISTGNGIKLYLSTAGEMAEEEKK